MMEVAARKLLTDTAKRMHVAIANLPPVFKLDAEFDGAFGGPDKSFFIYAQGCIKRHDRRNGRFADPHNANLIGFNQRDADRFAE